MAVGQKESRLPLTPPGQYVWGRHERKLPVLENETRDSMSSGETARFSLAR